MNHQTQYFYIGDESHLEIAILVDEDIAWFLVLRFSHETSDGFSGMDLQDPGEQRQPSGHT